VTSTDHQTEDTKTIRIETPSYICKTAQPGQFLMIWIPGIDEIPMSISNIVGEHEIWITVKKLGEATSAIHKVTAGGILGLRGPYGNGFSLEGRNALIVAGGIGAAPLLFLTSRLTSKNRKITIVLGARSEGKVTLQKDFEKLLRKNRFSSLIVATDDGSLGTRGFASDIARVLMEKERYERVYTCGPELMMQKVISTAMSRRLEVEASLERYMRCGIGICGSCYIGKYLVCKDGPVFSSEKLKEIVKFLEMK